MPQKTPLFQKVTLVSACLILLFSYSFAQKTCPASNNEWQWPTHTNWYFGTSRQISFGAAGTGAAVGSNFNGPLGWYQSYESIACASDENGNLLMATNGVEFWDGGGNAIAIPGGRFLTGAENPAGAAGSAVQGVLVVKHPLDVDNYYFFCTDDAISGEANQTYGFNYFIYNKATGVVTGPTRLQTAAGQNFRSTEQIAATFHNNTVDVWIATHTSVPGGSRTYLAYKLTCSGVDPTPVASTLGFNVTTGAGPGTFSNERASLQFSWDGTRAAATHHNGSGTWDPVLSITVMDFDNQTGVFSNAQGLGDGSVSNSNPYDCEWSPSGNRLFVTFLGGAPLLGRVGYFNVGTGAYTQVGTTATGTDLGSIKLGGDGNMYIGSFNTAPWGYRNSLATITAPDGAANFNENGQAVGAGVVGYGLPNAFIPPRDWLEIVDPQPLTECDIPVNLDVNWLCKGTNAEDALNFPTAWSGDHVTNPNGDFNPPGAGNYTVYYNICSIWDTLDITVGTCGCTSELQDVAPSICAGETVLLDTMVTGNSGVGVWTIQEDPGGVPLATLNISGGDTIFDASDLVTAPGDYKLYFTVDGSCTDSITITVNPIPDPQITAFGPLCEDSVITNMVATPIGGVWSIDGTINPTGIFDPAVLGTTPSPHEVIYGVLVNGCAAADTLEVTVNARADATIDPAGPFCADDDPFQLTTTQAGGTWSGTGVNATGIFNPANAGAGNFVITYKIGGLCGDEQTVNIHVDPVRDATIVPFGPTLCILDPAENLVAAEAGGTWTVNGVVEGSGQFDPGTYGAGNYEIIYTIGDPCGDADTIDIEVVAQYDASITVDPANDTVCDSDASFQINAVTAGGNWSATCGACISATGEFDPSQATIGTNTITYEFLGACGDLKTVDVEVLPTITSTVTAGDNALCEDEQTQLTATFLPDPVPFGLAVPGVWTIVSPVGATGLDPITGVFDATVSGPGSFDIEFVSAYPCYVSGSTTITVDAMPDPTITPVADVCANDPAVNLTAVTIGTWTTDAPAGSITGNSFDPSIAGAGNWSVTNTVVNGECTADDQITITVLPVPVANLTNPADVCINDPLVDLTANTDNQTGTWSGTGVAGTNFDPSTVAAGDYTLTYTIAGQCPFTGDVTITVLPIPVPVISGANEICSNDPSTLPLSATPSGGVWSGTGVNGTGVFDPNGLNPGTYTITYSMNGQCPADTTYDVRILNVPPSDFDLVDRQICEGESAFTINLSDTIAANVVWGIESAGNAYVAAGDQFVMNSGPGLFDVYLIQTYANGCVDSIRKSDYLEVVETPVADFNIGQNPLKTIDPTTTFTNTSSLPHDSVTWNFTSKGIPSTVEGIWGTLSNPQLVTFNSTYDDTVNVCLDISNKGCKDDICKTVIIRATTTIFVPNAFTPDGDGVNDIFRPEGVNHGDDGYKFLVFNRWGELIYETDDYTQGWNGKKYNTMQDAQVDVYVWKLIYIDHFSGEEQEARIGHVSLLR